MEREKAIFFDLDGTLTDPGEGITNSVLYALHKLGIEETDRSRLYSFIGPPLTESFSRVYGLSPETSLEAALSFQEYFARSGIYENRVYAGVSQLLSALSRRGFKLVLATSKPEPFARKILEYFQLDEYFFAVCGAEMDEKTRMEKTEVIAYALEKTGLDPAACMMVGDRKHDILGGKAFGMKTVGVLYGYGSEKELTLAGADLICRSVEELKEVLFS